MGVSLNGAGRDRRSRYRPMAEINVTPFVDVMLVLLIIFMVAAPMLTVGVPVELPRTAAAPMQDETAPLTISVNPRGEIYLQETRIAMEEVVPRLQAIARNGVDERVFIRGDRALAYGQMMQIVGMVSGAGFRRIGLVTEQADTPPRAAAPAGTPAVAPATAPPRRS